MNFKYYQIKLNNINNCVAYTQKLLIELNAKIVEKVKKQ